MPACSPTARQTFSRTDRPRNSVLIWNVRPRPRRTRAACGSAVMSSPLKQDTPGRWRQPAGDQVDERRLAGAVRADQRMARTGLETEMNVVRHDQRAEAFVQADGFQRRVSSPPQQHPIDQSEHCRRARTSPAAPAAGRSRNTRTRDPSSPVDPARSCRALAPTNAPYSRPMPPNTSMMTISPERSKPSTVRPTNCVVCASKRAGDAGERGGYRVDGQQPPPHRRADRVHAGRRSRECRPASGRTASAPGDARTTRRGTARRGNRDRRCGRT